MKKLIAIIITFIFMLEGTSYGLRVPLICNTARSITKSDVDRWVEKARYGSLFKFKDDLEKGLNKDGPVKWPGGIRYGTVKVVFKVYPCSVNRLKIEVHPEDEWKKGFDEMKTIKKYSKKRNNDFNHGGFGQVVIELYRGLEGRNFLFISEVQPSPEYRNISKTRRKHLDRWRNKAIEGIIKWAKANDFLIFAMHPRPAHDLYDLGKYELTKNYIEPFTDKTIWVTRKSEHIVSPIYVYAGNPKIEANIRKIGNKTVKRSVSEKLKIAKSARNSL